MKRVLTQKFFSRPTVEVAKDLLGKYLVRKIGKKIISAMITEVEAYDGFKDKASHAHRGLTKRNFPMFGPAGRWYVYFTYGMHWMLNIVCGKKNYPAAVLIRGVAIGHPISQILKGSLHSGHRMSRNSTLALNGPGKLTKYLKIDKRFNNLPANKKTGLWIVSSVILSEAKESYKNLKMYSSPRIGVAYAGSVWSKKQWRFFLAD